MMHSRNTKLRVSAFVHLCICAFAQFIIILYYNATLTNFNMASSEASKKSKVLAHKHPLTADASSMLSNEIAQWHKTRDESNGEEEPLGFLYPTKNDPDFAVNIARRREFNDTKYNIVIPTSQRQMEEEATKMCGAAFELAPHQLFVRNFLSVMTPYNSMLLYH